MTGPQSTTGNLHRFADIALHSDTPLDELEVASSAIPLCQVRWHRSWPSFPEGQSRPCVVHESPLLKIVRRGRSYDALYPGRARFVIRDEGGLIDCYSPRGASPEARHYLLDHMLPRVLDLHGSTVLHASAIALDGGTVLLAGRSGAGKSTLAAVLGGGPGVLLSDDAVCIKERGGRLIAVPTYPSLRLKPESRNRVEPAPVAAHATNAGIHPLAGVFLLCPQTAGSDTQTVTVEPIRPLDIYEGLVGNMLSFAPDREQTMRRHFLMAGRIHGSVPVHRLRYRRGYALLDEVTARIQATGQDYRKAFSSNG